MPIGFVTAIVSSIIVMAKITSLEVIGPNLAVVFLTLLYAGIVKIVVEVLLVRK